MNFGGQNNLQQQMFQEAVQELSMRDMFKQYNALVERCFDECVTGFRSKKMTGGEQECVKKCATKFTTFTQRVASRFQELQVKMNEQQQNTFGR
mmetsp:Transcript_34361/g.50505  ORF Transcript_34361/g.50505 Transcript_34361/m.50505 type:complete len:94 (-) Transcript_34361:152-433(-)